MNAWRRVFMITVAFWFAAWGIKVHFFVWLFRSNMATDLVLGPFPELMRSTATAATLYFLPLLGLPLLYKPSPLRARALSVLMGISAAGSMMHQQFYNDATFTVLIWIAIWLFWLSFQGEREPGEAAREARITTKGMVAMIFFGGFLGKLTGAYWSGEIFEEVYFYQKDYFLYAWLRDVLSAQQISLAATWFSRGAILGEAAVVIGAFALSYRRWTLLVMAVLVGMVAISEPWLFSVLGGMMGVVVANLLWEEGGLRGLTGRPRESG